MQGPEQKPDDVEIRNQQETDAAEVSVRGGAAIRATVITGYN